MEHYFITTPGKPEREVTKQEWVDYERGAGFSGSGSLSEPSTWSFDGALGVSGRRAYDRQTED